MRAKIASGVGGWVGIVNVALKGAELVSAGGVETGVDDELSINDVDGPELLSRRKKRLRIVVPFLILLEPLVEHEQLLYCLLDWISSSLVAGLQ